MFRLSKMTDYGVVVLGCLARSPDRQMSAGEVAEATGLGVPTVAQVLKTLANGDLVISHRGARGGYRLAVPAGAVTVRDIVTAFEGPLAITACVHGSEEPCGVEGMCALRGSWDRVNDAIGAALDGVTLADMMTPQPPARRSWSLAARDETDSLEMR